MQKRWLAIRDGDPHLWVEYQSPPPAEAPRSISTTVPTLFSRGSCPLTHLRIVSIFAILCQNTSHLKMGNPVGLGLYKAALADTPREAFNWRLAYSVICFGLLGAARGLDEGLISTTVAQKSFIAGKPVISFSVPFRAQSYGCR